MGVGILKMGGGGGASAEGAKVEVSRLMGDEDRSAKADLQNSWTRLRGGGTGGYFF